MFNFGLFFLKKYPYKTLIDKLNVVLEYIQKQLVQNVKENKEQLFLTDDTKQHKECVYYLDKPCDSYICNITPIVSGTAIKCGAWDNTYAYPNVISADDVDEQNIISGIGIKAQPTERLVENIISVKENPYYSNADIPEYELKNIDLADCYTHPITKEVKTHSYKIFKPTYEEETFFDSEMIYSNSNTVIDEFTDGSLEPHFYIEASPTKHQYEEYLKNIQPGITINFISKTTDSMKVIINDSITLLDFFKFADSINNEVYKDEQSEVYTVDAVFNNRDRYV